jgi:hypothetical protein
MAIRGFELGTETDRMFADAQQKRAEREVGKTEFQQVVDASGTKPMTPEEMLYAGASLAPVTGDIIGYKEAPEDFERAYELLKKGYKEKDLVNLGLGTAFAGLTALGLLPGVGFVSRIGKNAARDKIQDLVKEGNLDEAADIMLKTSKVLEDKALKSKKSEAQLKQLAAAKIELDKKLGKKPTSKDLLYAELPREQFPNMNTQQHSDLIDGLSNDVDIQNYLSSKYDNAKDSIEVAFPEIFRPAKSEMAAMTSKRQPSLVSQNVSFNDLRKDATIRIDSPAGKDVLTGETYVEKKIRQNKEYMERNPNASPVGLYEGITGRANNVKFNPKELQGIKGEMGEDAFRMTGDAGTGMFNKLEELEGKIKKEGYKPTNIKITVTEDGTPYVTEGNHRLAEALKSDRPFITADINYLRGGEAVDGPLNPKSIGIGSGEKQKSGLMAMTTKREPSPVREMTKLEQVLSDVPKADADKLDDIDLYKFMDNFESKYDDFDLALEQSKLPKEQLNKAEIDFMDSMSNIDKIYTKRREKNLNKYKELDKHAESADYEFTQAMDSAYENALETVDETAEEIFGRAMSKEELSPIKQRGNLIFDNYFFNELDTVLIDTNLIEDYNSLKNLYKAIDKNRGGLMARN